METDITAIVEIQDLTKVSGGDWIDESFGLIAGLAFGAGVLGSGGLLAAAAGAGALFLAWK
jgi:hypothetical protein